MDDKPDFPLTSRPECSVFVRPPAPPTPVPDPPPRRVQPEAKREVARLALSPQSVFDAGATLVWSLITMH